MTDTPADQVRVSSRVLAAIGALLFTAYAVWSAFNLVASPRRGEYFLFGIFIVTSGTAAAMCWWFVLRGHIAESRGVMRAGCLSGLVVGGAAFLAGFIGPIILMPDANQGPFLGIFITGPLGCVVGTAVGVMFARLRRRKAQS